MSNTVVVNVQANTSAATADITTTTVAVDNLTKANKKLNNETEQVASGFEDVTKNGGAIAILDQLTGGLASRVRDTYEATKLFNFSLKGMKKALIATGIGALVVALGLIIAYWDEIVALITGANAKLEEQKLVYDDLNKSTSAYIKLLQAQKKLGEDEGKNVTKVIAKLKEKLELLLKETKERKEQITQDLKGFLTAEQRTALETEFYERSLQIFSLRTDILNLDKEALKVKEDAKILTDKELIEAQKLADFKKTELELIRVGQVNTQKEIRAEELNQVDIKYKLLLDKAKLYYGKDSEQAKALITSRDEKLAALQDKFDTEDETKRQEALDKQKADKQALTDFITISTEQERENELLALDEQNIILQERFKDDKDALLDIEFAYLEKLKELKVGHAEEDNVIRQKSLDDETAITDAKKALQLGLVSAAGNAIGALGSLFEEGTAASKAAALAEIIIGTGVGYVQGLDIAQKSAKGTGAAAAFAFPIFYAQQIAAVAGAAKQASNILKKVPGGGGGGGGLNPTPPPIPAQAPSFNIVGQGQGNQIASALGEQQQQPVQAFVVSQDVTTAQSLENGIIQGATLGG